MEPKVWNKHHGDAPVGAVHVGRSSPYGNPFRIGEHGDRREVILKFITKLAANPEAIAMVRNDLKGKHLECFCAPQMCHADILLALANCDEKDIGKVLNGATEMLLVQPNFEAPKPKAPRTRGVIAPKPAKQVSEKVIVHAGNKPEDNSGVPLSPALLERFKPIELTAIATEIAAAHKAFTARAKPLNKLTLEALPEGLADWDSSTQHLNDMIKNTTIQSLKERCTTKRDKLVRSREWLASIIETHRHG